MAQVFPNANEGAALWLLPHHQLGSAKVLHRSRGICLTEGRYHNPSNDGRGASRLPARHLHPAAPLAALPQVQTISPV